MECSLSPTHGNRVCCCFSFLYIVCVPESMLHTSTRITGVPPPPPPPSPPTPYFHYSKSPYCYKNCRLRVSLVFPGKSALGTRLWFSLKDSRASETRARVKITGTRERREKHESLGFVCSPSFFSLPCMLERCRNTELQRSVALKIVVANRPEEHDLLKCF